MEQTNIDFSPTNSKKAYIDPKKKMNIIETGKSHWAVVNAKTGKMVLISINEDYATAFYTLREEARVAKRELSKSFPRRKFKVVKVPVPTVEFVPNLKLGGKK